MSVPAPPDGFVEFVATRSAALLRSAWLLTGDAGKAEDLLQTVLAQVWPRWRRRWRYEVPTAALPDSGDHTDLAGDSATRDAVQCALEGDV
jgi:hypothetical protein